MTPTPMDGIKVTLDLPENPIKADDTFYVDMQIENNMPDHFTRIPLFCLLEAADTFWYYPFWTTEPAWETLLILSSGTTNRRIIYPMT